MILSNLMVNMVRKNTVNYALKARIILYRMAMCCISGLMFRKYQVLSFKFQEKARAYTVKTFDLKLETI